MKPKVSIIIPVYNAEKYLSRSLDSLLVQSLSEIEIICINDGSNDGSQTVLKDYSQKDNRIIVIDMVNSGVSAARNKGIEVASGEFIGFLDSDDWVDKDMYKNMYTTAIEEMADIVMCTYMREFGTHSKIKHFDFPAKIKYTNEEVHLHVLRRLIGPINEEIAIPENMDAWGTVWSKIYKSQLIKENQIKFTDLNEIGTNEDSLFNIYSTYYAKSFVFLNEPYYHYWRQNDGSITTKYKPQLFTRWLNLFSIIQEFIKENQLSNVYYEALNNRICLNMLGLGMNISSNSNRSSTLEKFKEIKVALNHKKIINAFQQFDLKKLPPHWRVFYFFAKKNWVIPFHGMLKTINYLRHTVK